MNKDRLIAAVYCGLNIHWTVVIYYNTADSCTLGGLKKTVRCRIDPWMLNWVKNIHGIYL